MSFGRKKLQWEDKKRENVKEKGSIKKVKIKV
jgi:hypothetical protein